MYQKFFITNRRRFLLVFFLVSLLLFFTTAYLRFVNAATKTWDGGGADNNWSTCANWNLDTCPAAGDTVVFDGTSTKDVTINSGFAGTIASIQINAGYTGTITLARSLTVTSTFTQSSGTFNGANQTIVLSGALTINSGSIFTSTSGNLILNAGLTINSGATFNHNNGNFIFAGSSSPTISCGSKTFNLVTFSKTSNPVTTINSDCSLPLGNNPTVTTGSGSNTLNLNGTLSGSGILTLNTTTFNLTSTSTISGFTGLVSPSITSLTGTNADFSSYTTFNITSSNNLTLSSGASLTFPNPTGTGINLGTVTINSGTTFISSPGNINIATNLTIDPAATFNHNNGTITFIGSNNQTLACGNKAFNLVTFSKTNNPVTTINSDCSLPLGNNPIVTTGSTANTINLNGTFAGTGTLTLNSTVLNLTATSMISGFTGLVSPSITSIAGLNADFSSYTTFNITGSNNLTLSSGASLTFPNPTGTGINLGTVAINSGTSFTSSPGNINISSNLTIDPAATFNHNNGTITFTGSNNQTLACGNKIFNRIVIARTATGSYSFTVGSDCHLPLGNNPNVAISSSNTAGTLRLNGTLSGTGTLTLGIYSYISFDSSTAALSGFNGLITRGISGVTSAVIDLSIYTTFTQTSTTPLTITSGGTLKLPTPSSAFTFGDVIINAGSAFEAGAGDLTIAGRLTINAGGTFSAPSGTLFLGDDLIISSSGTFAANTGTINIYGTNQGVTLSCGNATFNSVIINKTNTGNSTSYDNYTTINSDCVLPLGNNPTVVGGNQVNPTNTIMLNGTLTGTGTLTLGSYTDNLSFSATASIQGFTGLVAVGIGSIAGYQADFSSYTTFNLTGATNMVLTSGGSITFPAPTGTGINIGNLTVNSGTTFNGNDVGDMTVSGYLRAETGSTFKAPGGTLFLGGDLTISSTSFFDANNGTISLYGITPYISLSCGNASLAHFAINKTNQGDFTNYNNTVAVGSDCNLPFGNNPVIKVGSLSNNATNTLLINGAISGTGILAMDSKTTNLNFTATTVISGFTGLSANNITSAGYNADFSQYSPFTTAGNVTITSGALSLPNTSMANLVISGGSLTLGTGTTSINGQLTISGTGQLNANGGTVNFSGGTASLSCNNAVFNSVSFLGQTGTKTVGNNCTLPLGNNPTIPQSITVNGTLTGSGSLTQTAGAITLNTGGSITGFNELIGNSSTLTIAGATADFSSFTNIVIGSTFTLSSGSFTAGVSTNMSVGSTFTITNGTFTAPGGNLSVTGNFSHSGGTFNHNNGTVVLTGGNQTITGTNTFYNLTKEISSPNGYVLTMPASVTQTVVNNLVLKGNSTSNRLFLRSSSTGTQYRIDPQASRDMLYIDARDGNNISGTTLQLAGTGSLNNGNNTNFGFTNTAPNNPSSLGPSSVVQGNAISSYNPTLSFSIRDTANPLDTLSYRLQISTVSDFSTVVVDYTSGLLSQGTKSFTVGQALGSGTYTAGNAGQTLPVGNYYWRVKTTDQEGAESLYSTANSGNIAFFISGAPNNPTSLGPAAFVNGSLGSNNQPQLTFTITDPDVGDTVKYKIEVSSVSNFSSLVIEYSSPLQAQGATSFSVGQPANGGSYTFGSEGQSLSTGSYYWRVKAIDNNSLESGYSVAHSGAIAFVINSIPNIPSNITPTNVTDGSTTTNSQPSFSFDISDPDVSDTVRFQIQIDDSSDFSSPVVSYTSPFTAQGAASFTVGQLAGGGTYTAGSSGQLLSNGAYYLRIRATDNNSLSSAYFLANSGNISFILNGTPNAPTNLGPSALTNGSASTNYQPTFTFDITDPDIGDTVKYQIQIDDSSNFSSLIIDYTSGLQSQGSLSFTVGQPTGAGTYTIGSEGQLLSSDGYYWRIRAIDQNDLQSSFVVANNGNQAFTVTQAPNEPTSLGPVNLTNGSTTTDNTPHLSFSISDPDASDSVRYEIDISMESDYSTLAAHFISTTLAQGTHTYTSTSLALGSYYWRVRTIDQHGISSSYTQANNGAIAFTIIPQEYNPNNPGSLGPVSMVNGSTSINTQPEFTFSLSDSNASNTVKFQLQISTASDFNSPIVDYTSELQTQGIAGFTIGQTSGNGSYSTGSEGQTLTSGRYYWRVKAIDSTGLSSSFATANSGTVAFVISQNPNIPSDLGTTQVIDGSISSETQPSFTFTTSDPDSLDTLAYQIQIDDSSDFGSVIVSYTSGQLGQGAASFTVGQPTNGGTYSVGSSGQTLLNGNYYWRVRVIDNNGLVSAYSSANNADIAFRIGGLPQVPSGFSPGNLFNGSATIQTQPSFTFTLSDPDISDTIGFHLQISRNNNYSDIAVDYVSALEAQGTRTFTVGQPVASGNYYSGAEGQTFDSGTYYLRISAFDNLGNTSPYTNINNGAVAFKITKSPDQPSGLGPSHLIDSSISSDLSPTFSFSITDPDGDDTGYIIQIDDAPDFNSPIIAYTSPYTGDNNKQFSVGQHAGLGHYTTGNHGQVLLSGTYYWRVKSIDENGIESAFVNANSGNSAFILSAAPDLPSNIGPISVIDGSTSTSGQPTFIFSLSDPDISDLVKYHFQLSNSSDFSSIIVDYTSDLQIQDARQFILGQPAGTGSYSVGSEGQTLTTGNYYWRVRGIDSSDIASAFRVANSGNVAFKITQKPTTPFNLGPTEFTNGTISQNTKPTFTFRAVDPDLLDSVSYQIQIADNSEFTSIVVDYRSTLQVQGAKSFTVGQNPGLGSYNRGHLGQALSAGSYYWRVRTIDQGGVTSEYSIPNSGDIAFVITQPPPTPTPTASPSEIINSPTPTITIDITPTDILPSTTMSMTPSIASPSVLEPTEPRQNVSSPFIPDSTVSLPSLNQETIVTAFIGIAVAEQLVTGSIMHYAVLVVNRIRRRKSWGVVYDSISKRPISQALVRVYDGRSDVLVTTGVTDALGIFRLQVKKGTYRIEVSHREYRFPSEIVTGSVDQKYRDIYQGTLFTINRDGESIALAIPLDKKSTRIISPLIKVLSSIQSGWNKISPLIFVLGVLLSIYATMQSPNVLNVVVLILYAIMLLLKVSYSFVTRLGKIKSINGELLGGVEIGLYDADFGTLISKTNSTERGEYAFYVRPGNYLLKVTDPRYSLAKGNQIKIDRSSIQDGIQIIKKELKIIKR